MATFEPRYADHRGHRILRLDFVGLSEPELLAGLQRANDVIRAAAPDSLRILANYQSPLTPAAAELLKRFAIAARPHIRATAVIGSSFWKIIFTDVQVHGREDLVIFDDEASALDWLATR